MVMKNTTTKFSVVVGNYFYFLSLPTSQRYKIMLPKREVAMISFFASIFYTVNAQISLVRFGYIANGIN